LQVCQRRLTTVENSNGFSRSMSRDRCHAVSSSSYKSVVVSPVCRFTVTTQQHFATVTSVVIPSPAETTA
jgi:hypothetical protein